MYLRKKFSVRMHLQSTNIKILCATKLRNNRVLKVLQNDKSGDFDLARHLSIFATDPSLK